MEIYLLPFAVEALGYNRKIYKDIDRLYQSRKYEFYKAAKGHELYSHQIVTEGGLLQEEYCKKALGILLCAGKDEDVAKQLSAIFRKGWTYAYLFVENNSEIDLGKFIKNAARKAGGLDKVSDDWLNSQLFVVYFLALNAGKPFAQNESLRFFEEVLHTRWQHYDGEMRISLKRATPDQLAKVKGLKNQVYAQHGRFVDYNGMYDKLKDRAESMALLFDYEKLSFPSIIEDVKFTETDIEEILLACQSDGVADYLCDAMYVRYMAKAYKDVKRRYFENNKETMYLELEGLEKEIAAAKQETNRLSGALEEARDRIGVLEKENARLKDELAEEKKNRQELNGLREFLFSLDLQEEYREAQYDPDELKNYKAVLIGGHEKWQARMKELLPKFIFVHPDNVAFDLRLLDGVGTVFVYTNYLNHSIYYRAMGAIAGKNVQVGFISQANEALVLKHIANFFKEAE